MDSIEQLGTVTARATMTAAVEILRIRQIDPLASGYDMNALILTLREETKAALDSILSQAKEVGTGMSPLLAETLVKVEAVSAAKRTIERLHGEV